MNIILFANGSSENHGCEAIDFTCIEMFSKYCDIIYIATLNKNADENIQGYNNVELIEYHYEGKQDFYHKLKRKLFGIKKNDYWFDEIEQVVDNVDLAISVGGDNYCYNNNDWIYECHKLFVEKEIPTILLGCSINEVDKKMLEDLKTYRLIIAREHETYNLLLEQSLNVRYLPDPAFSLEMKEDLKSGLLDSKHYIGINLSPLVMELGGNQQLIMRNYIELISHVLKKTDCDILLIPHVVFKNKYGDIASLKKIEEHFSSDRIHIIPYKDARVIKWYISKCKILVTARTHASIAAYSTNVPTIVIGYSIKSLGIAKDLFGMTEKYVINIDNFTKENDLLNDYLWVESNYDSIRDMLKKRNQSMIPLSKDYPQMIFEELEMKVEK